MIQVNELKNKLTEWLNTLVCLQEELVHIKTSIFQSISMDYETNVIEIENYVDYIAAGENIIAIMRNEMGLVCQKADAKRI